MRKVIKESVLVMYEGLSDEKELLWEEPRRRNVNRESRKYRDAEQE